MLCPQAPSKNLYVVFRKFYQFSLVNNFQIYVLLSVSTPVQVSIISHLDHHFPSGLRLSFSQYGSVFSLLPGLKTFSDSLWLLGWKSNMMWPRAPCKVWLFSLMPFLPPLCSLFKFPDTSAPPCYRGFIHATLFPGTLFSLFFFCSVDS